jgi:hypothetical protein
VNPVEPETIRLYLLGKLDQTALAVVEERLLTDELFYDELLMAEEELTDQYLTNGLSGEEQHSFETHFLSAPERRQKLRFARSLKRYVSEASAVPAQANIEDSFAPAGHPPESRAKKRPFLSFLPIRNPVIAYSLVAAVLLAMIGVSWTVLKSSRPTTHLAGNVLLVTLTPGLSRESGEIKSIRIQPGIDSVQLQLGLISDEYQIYRAELLNSERSSVLTKEDLKPEYAPGNKIVNLTVPVELLKRDDYRVKLSGRRPDGGHEDVGGYVFRVVE